MEKIKKYIISHTSSIILIVVFIICSVFICAVSNYILDLYEIDNNTNGIFSSRTIYFKVNNTENVDFSVLCNNEEFEDISVLRKKEANTFGAYEIITLNKNLNTINGRSFSKNDFYSNKCVAYIGKNADKIYDTDNLIIDNKHYDVIGRFSDNKVDSLNFTVLYTTGNLQNIDTNCTFGMDGNNSIKLKSAYNELVKNIERQGGKVTKLSVNAMSVAAFIFIKADLIKLILLTILLLVLVIVLVSIFWLYSKKQYIAACHIIGIPKVNRKIINEFIKIFVLTLAVTFLLLSLIIFDNGLSLFVFISSLITGLLVSFISIKISLRKLKKQEISQIMESDYE